MPDAMEIHPECFCWARDPGGLLACDRVTDHLGPHSWEPWTPQAQQRGYPGA